ncbi:MAG: DUF3750 domain-containing protein [Candidatus Tectimicrobiota bacterium]
MGCRRRRGRMIWLLIVVGVYGLGPLLVYLTGGARLRGDWRLASQQSVGLAPAPGQVREAVVQVYAARAFAWRGVFSVHTWMAVKPEQADHYTRYEVIGWRFYRGLSPVSVSSERAPDAQWFGASPWLLRELRGEPAAALIAALPAVVAAYPYPRRYRVWPGPNSNTFIAYLGRQFPQLRLVLPSHAVGKDYVARGWSVIRSPSGTGVQATVSGLLGVLVGWEEGVQVNVLGLTVGLDPLGLAIELPGLGRLGKARRP